MAEHIARLMLYLPSDLKDWLEAEVVLRKRRGEKLTTQAVPINMSSIIVETLREKQMNDPNRGVSP